MPVDIAYGRGYLEEETSSVLLVSGDNDRGYYDPPTWEQVMHSRLMFVPGKLKN